MSKLCDSYWRQRVMGHWQYILYVNTIWFVLHCIISLCLFIIPVKIQSSPFCFVLWFFFGNFWSTEDFNWKKKLKKKVFLWRRRKKKKEDDLLFPLHCDGELTQRLSETLPVSQERPQTLNIRNSPGPTGVPADVWPVARRSELPPG